MPFLTFRSELGTTLNEQKFSKKEISSPSACKLRITFEGQEELISKRGIRRLRKDRNLLNFGMKTDILSPSSSMIKKDSFPNGKVYWMMSSSSKQYQRLNFPNRFKG